MSTHQSTNLVGHIGVLIQVAAIIEDEVMKEKIIDFVDRYYTLCIANNFKRDGMYPESFSYHRGYADETMQTLSCWKIISVCLNRKLTRCAVLLQNPLHVRSLLSVRRWFINRLDFRMEIWLRLMIPRRIQ